MKNKDVKDIIPYLDKKIEITRLNGDKFEAILWKITITSDWAEIMIKPLDMNGGHWFGLKNVKTVKLCLKEIKW